MVAMSKSRPRGSFTRPPKTRCSRLLVAPPAGAAGSVAATADGLGDRLADLLRGAAADLLDLLLGALEAALGGVARGAGDAPAGRGEDAALARRGWEQQAEQRA